MKNEKWIYDDNGNLKQINCQTKKDKYGNQRNIFKENLTADTLFLIVCGIVFFIGAFSFMNAFFFKFVGAGA